MTIRDSRYTVELDNNKKISHNVECWLSDFSNLILLEVVYYCLYRLTINTYIGEVLSDMSLHWKI